MARRHFTTFDALRFFAFFKVFLLHLPIHSFSLFSFLKAGGGIGVNFFFVLSGFLITYIILEEKQQTGKLNLYHFYLRRILRIWPLFYAMILFAWLTPIIIGYFGFTASQEGYEPNWLMSVLFLENYKMMFSGEFPNTSPLGVMWSLCIEEHFYIVWGLVLFLVKIRHVPVVILCSLLIANITRIFYTEIQWSFTDLPSNLDYFAYGAIPAWILIQKQSWLEKMDHFIKTPYQYGIVVMILTYVMISPNIRYANQDLVEPGLFGISFFTLILLTLLNKNRIHISDTNILSKLGIYTYGLYLFHTIVINFLKQVYMRYSWSLDVIFHAWIFSLIALLLTVLVSILSYEIFEKQFLKLKKYFYSR